MPDPHTYQAAGWLIVAIASLCVSFNQIVKVVDRIKGHPPVEELKSHADALTQRVGVLERNDAEAVARRRAIYSKMEDMEKRIRGEIKSELHAVNQSIGKLSTGQAGMEENNRFQNQSLLVITDRLNRLIERFMK